jgi:hypothetical protein
LTAGLLAATVSTWAVGRESVRFARLDTLEVQLDDTAIGSFHALAHEKTQQLGTMNEPFLGRKRVTFGSIISPATASPTIALVPSSGHLQATEPAAPVPEPSTYAMLLGGLALVGFLARRRTPR